MEVVLEVDLCEVVERIDLESTDLGRRVSVNQWIRYLVDCQVGVRSTLVSG